MSFIADILAKLGFGAAMTGTQGCVYLFSDEPEAPSCLIEK